jgi:hypothetical protein
LPDTNTLAYLASSSATKEKSFIKLTPGHRNFARRFFASLHGLQIQRSEGVSRATKEKLFHELLFHGQNKIRILVQVY